MSTTKFIEVMIEKQLHSINIDNIAMIKEIDPYTTEINLLSKSDNEQIKFQVHYAYSELKKLFKNENRIGIDGTLYDFK